MPLAHFLAFWLAAPDAHNRAHLLSSTGHSHWIYVAGAGFFGGVLAMAGFIRSCVEAHATASGLTRYAVARLAPFQVVAFVLLEMVERASSGHGLLATLVEPAVLIGIILQLLVAIAGAVLLRAVARVVETLRARALPARLRESGHRFLVRFIHVPRLRLDAAGFTLRGPPLTQ